MPPDIAVTEAREKALLTPELKSSIMAARTIRLWSRTRVRSGW